MSLIPKVTLAAILSLGVSPLALAQEATDPETSAAPTAGAEADATTDAGATGGADANTAAGAGVGTTDADFRDQADVEERLEDRGWEDLSLELSGNEFTGTGTLYDEEVDLRVDARTGRVLAPERLTADQISAKLEDEGYSEVSDVREAGTEFTASADRFGEDVDLRIDAATGQVIDPRELSSDQITELLEEEDYEDVTVFERDRGYGSIYAVASDDDTTFLLEINPVTGEIESELEER